MRKSSLVTWVAGLVVLAPVFGHGDPILQYTSGNSGIEKDDVGESFTTPQDLLYGDISFNFYSDIPATTPSAAGKAFILNQPYDGKPAALNAKTPGFLAESISSADEVYTFDPGFILNAATTYYLYENKVIDASYSGTGFPGTTGYVRSSEATGHDFIPMGSDSFNFSLDGTPVGEPIAIPEPSAGWLTGLGAAALGLAVMRRRQTSRA